MNVNLETLLARVREVEGLCKTQCESNNYDHSPYMCGLANGLVLARAVLLDIEPEFKTAPERWLGDAAVSHVPEAWGHSVKLVAPGSVQFQPGSRVSLVAQK